MSENDRRDLRMNRIGLVFQEFALVEYVSVLENVLLPFRMGYVMKLTADVRARAGDLLVQAGLRGFEKRFPY